MKTIVASLAVMLCLVGCGDDGDEKNSGGTSARGCLTMDEDGRPLQCYSYSGSNANLIPGVGGGALFCPLEMENVKQVASCPRNSSLVGRCETDLGFEMKQTVFYYLPEGDLEEAANMYEAICFSGVWTRH